jgi:hypothetical protein
VGSAQFLRPFRAEDRHANSAAPAGTDAPVDIPSGELKLNREFDLASSAGTTIRLDFDGDQSMKLTGNGNGHGNGGGNYMMTPVIGIVSVH